MKLRRAIWPFLASVVVVGFLLVAVFPTRTYLAQRAALSRAATQLEVLKDQNHELDARATQLRSDAEIERLARERFNLVRPGEEAYAVLPAPGAPTTTTVPTAMGAPDPAKDPHQNLVQRAWSAVTGLF